MALGRDLYFLKVQTPRQSLLREDSMLAERQSVRSDVAGRADPMTLTATSSPNESSSAVVGSTFKEFYKIGVLSYCRGDIVDGSEIVSNCSTPSAKFWFNAAEVWNLHDKTLQNRNLKRGLQAYRKVAEWANVAIIIASACAGIALLASVLAVGSRAGSLLACFCTTVGFL